MANTYGTNGNYTNIGLDKKHAATLKSISDQLKQTTGVYLPIATLMNGALANGGMEAVKQYAAKVKTAFGS